METGRWAVGVEAKIGEKEEKELRRGGEGQGVRGGGGG